ncbi:MAG TPA: vWA domain-containing protein [Micromonosporaceae bacterium]
MPYQTLATQATPALVIYLLDMSVSMNDAVDEESEEPSESKSELVTRTLSRAIREMVRRSTRGTQPLARYRVAAFAYNDEIHDVFGGARPITEVIQIGVPVMTPSGTTDTAKAFEHAEQLLISMHGELQDCPAPLICHFTDGSFTDTSPLPVAERIRQMTFPDGPVLIENIFFDAGALAKPVTDPYTWPGILTKEDLASTYAYDLYEMSSVIPDSYLSLFSERGYAMQPGARLFFPGGNAEMVEAAFTMSGMTPIA